MDTDLDTLVTALYVTVDDLLRAHPEQVPERREGTFAPQISDAELVCLAVMQALLGYHSETRWLRRAHKDFHLMFPHLPHQSGYNKRLRKLAGTMGWLVGQLARLTQVFDDNVWLVDSTPIECARSVDTVKRSDLSGWAEYGYCASHSRWFWGLRLHLVTTIHGLPVAWALTGAKADERQVLAAMLPLLPPTGQGRVQTLLADKGYRDRALEADLASHHICMIRPAYHNEPPRPGHEFLRPLRQTIESVFDSFKDQLDLEHHGGHTRQGVLTRIAQRVLALTAAIWNNDRQDLRPLRSLIAYDH
ncbi:MAG: IS982 family transposase [Micrococcales bacterium]|nr:IS982 family transposase [Micrococcales bacterium]